MSISINHKKLQITKYKDVRTHILNWVYDWEKNDEHDLDLCIDLKDDAYRIFLSMLTKKERKEIDKRLKEIEGDSKKCIECGKPLPEEWEGLCYECCESSGKVEGGGEK